MKIGFFLGIAQEDIKAGDSVSITLNRDGTFFINKTTPSSRGFHFNDEGTDVTKLRDKTEKKELTDRCKRMVVVKKEFSNKEDKS